MFLSISAPLTRQRINIFVVQGSRRVNQSPVASAFRRISSNPAAASARRATARLAEAKRRREADPTCDLIRSRALHACLGQARLYPISGFNAKAVYFTDKVRYIRTRKSVCRRGRGRQKGAA